ncbi:uncharacterized protein LOC110042071 [Orbicella faveolata]|uniref:uncharacterized protein LOC110042071 n=1 Tax=Orbicella faveolata TaxID=48498 RepID=UPI0009E5A1FD|nr:uncharacterized protein LOC110042071 [Orbicella faveolata]
MARIFRRAANKVKNSRDGHVSLGLLIFDEKVVYENFQKVVMAKADASMAMLKWAKNEENLALRDVFSKVFEVSSMWTNLMRDFTEEYHKYRKSFKEVLHQERVLDEARKREAMHATRLNRLQKQLDQNKRKSGDAGRPRTISNEMAEIITQAEQEQAELEVKTTKHEIFKARKLRESLSKISDGLQQWASKTLLVAGAYKKLADLISDTPTQLTDSKVFHGTGQTRCIVNNLARDLHIDPELSAQLAAVAKSTQPYLYAVSAPVKPDNAKYSYADLLSSSEQKSPKENAKKPKVKRAPQPLPHQHLKVKESALDDPNLRRPLSLTDLRPPPTSPPPPLPKHARQVVFRTNSAKESIGRKTKMNSKQSTGKIWYARTNISSDSDSDSDGYTEPITDGSFFERRSKMLCKVLSDGAINEVGMRGYAVRNTATQSSSRNFYHQLERRSSEEDIIQEDNEPDNYVALVN